MFEEAAGSLGHHDRTFAQQFDATIQNTCSGSQTGEIDCRVRGLLIGSQKEGVEEDVRVGVIRAFQLESSPEFGETRFGEFVLSLLFLEGLMSS